MRRDMNDRNELLLEPGDTVKDCFTANAKSNHSDGTWNVSNLSIFKDTYCYHPHATNGGGYNDSAVSVFPTSDMEVKGIVGRGRRDCNQYTTEVDIDVSQDGRVFTHLGRMKFCENNRTRVYIYFRTPGRYRVIRIRPADYFGVPVLNLGLIVAE